MRPPAGTPDALAEARLGQIETVISGLLRAGVLISLTLICLGTAISFIRHPAYMTSSVSLGHLTAPGAAFPRTAADVAAGVRQGRGQAIVTLGLMVLIATPVVRVAVSAVAFAWLRDRVFALIALTVLALLVLSFVLGSAI